MDSTKSGFCLFLTCVFIVSLFASCNGIKTVYRLDQGETHKYNVELEYTKKAHGVAGGKTKRETPSAQSQLFLVFSETVKEIGPEGEFHLEQQILDLDFKQTESPQLQTSHALKKAIGQTFHVILYPDGRIQHQQEESSDPGIAGEFGIRKLIQKNKIQFPKKYITSKFSWDTEKTEMVDALFYGNNEMTGKIHYKVVGFDNVMDIKTFQIDITEKLASVEPKKQDMTPSPFTSWVSGNQDMTATAYFSSDKRLPVKYEEKSTSSVIIELLFEKDDKKATSKTINEIESKLSISLAD